MSITTGLLLFFLILFIASFFVMSEYVLVRIRPSRLDFLVEEGNPQAKLLKNMTVKLDSYLSATQLGVTITSLALGWLGDPTFKRLFDTLFGNLPIPDAIATILSFALCLRWSFDRADLADRLERAVRHVVSSGVRTPDIAHPGVAAVSIIEMTDAVLAALAAE